MAFAEFEAPSPNRGNSGHERLGALFHHTGGLGFEQTIQKMLNPDSQISYHCLIGADGTRCTLVPDAEIAWHAGFSRFLGRERCNDFLLGIAFAGDTYVQPITQPQMNSALEWLDARWAPLGWEIGRMTDHRQASPGRKNDLNPIEWERLFAAIASHFAPPGVTNRVSGLKSPPPGRT